MRPFTISATAFFHGKKLLILGEALGEEEIKSGQPFVGPSGKFLKETLLQQAGFSFEQFHVTNVLSIRPPRNNIKELTLSKTDLKRQGLPILGQPIFRRHFLPTHYHEAMETLAWIKAQSFDFIIAFGGTALWLLTGDNRIGLFRGTLIHNLEGLPPVIGTYHPAAVLREFKMLPIVWADLVKARKHLTGDLPPPLQRTFIYSPTWDEIEETYYRFKREPWKQLGVDIETAPAIEQITTISFATPDYAICIPIWDKYAEPAKRDVYASPADEVRAWRWIEKFALLPNPKVLQNGLYDMQYLLEGPLPIILRNVTDDTNIMHHAAQIELPKDLGTLASLYLNEPGWKQMRTKHSEEEKADD